MVYTCWIVAYLRIFPCWTQGRMGTKCDEPFMFLSFAPGPSFLLCQAHHCGAFICEQVHFVQVSKQDASNRYNMPFTHTQPPYLSMNKIINHKNSNERMRYNGQDTDSDSDCERFRFVISFYTSSRFWSVLLTVYNSVYEYIGLTSAIVARSGTNSHS